MNAAAERARRYRARRRGGKRIARLEIDAFEVADLLVLAQASPRDLHTRKRRTGAFDMDDMWIEPDPEQNAQAQLAHVDLCETINRLGREGIDPRIILAALGMSCADLLTCTFGASSVAPWFEGQALMVRKAMDGKH